MVRRLLAAAAVSLALTTSATSASVFFSVPWSVGISVVQWIHERSEKVLYVEVVGEGGTLFQARRQGFRLAVEHAVGTVVSSETEVRNSHMVRDEIITYASGYVDRFEIVEQQEYSGRVQVKMKIWVKHSRLANRLLNRSEANGRVEGGRISAQLETLQHERKSSDRLLKSVLADFPARAFDVHLEQTQVFVDSNRHGQLEVAFHLRWNEHYLNSLSEVLKIIQRPIECKSWLNCGPAFTTEITVNQGFSGGIRAWFDDTEAYELVRREMVNSRPKIKLVILDASGQEQYKQCLTARELDVLDGYSPWYYINVVNRQQLEIDGKKVKRFNHYVNLSSVPPAELDQVKITVVRAGDC